jgi:hypothetical protein
MRVVAVLIDKLDLIGRSHVGDVNEGTILSVINYTFSELCVIPNFAPIAESIKESV